MSINRKVVLLNSFLLMGGTPLVMLLVFNFIGYQVSTVFVILTKLASFLLTVICLTKAKSVVKNEITLSLFVLFSILWCCRVFYDAYFNLNLHLRYSVSEYYLFYFFFSIIPFLFGFILKDDKSIYQVERGAAISNSLFSIVTFILYFSFLSNVKRLGVDENSVNPLVISYIAAMNIGYFTLTGVLKSFNAQSLVMIFLNLSLMGLGASKGSVIALVLALLLTLLIIKRLQFKFFFVILFFFSVIFFFNFSFLDVLTERFTFSVDANISGEKELRYYLWEVGINKFIENPLFGYFTDISEKDLGIIDSSTYPHNIIIEAFYSLGVIGGAILLSLIFLTIKRCIWIVRRRIYESWLLLIFLIAFYQNLFSGNIYSGALWFWFLMGVVNGRYLFLKSRYNAV